jgi:peptidoglycan-associated lipoprotein
MRFKILSVVAAVALLAACETAPQESATAEGSGAQQAAAAPSGPMMGSQEDLVVSVGDRVFFDYDKYSLTADSQKVLQGQAAWLKKNAGKNVVIEGHCDERGTREYNLALGERRANSVKDYLVALGVAADRVSTVSYGKERPVALGHDDGAWSQNRRGVTIVR